MRAFDLWRRAPLAVALCLLSFAAVACSQPRDEAALYDGGAVGGPLLRSPNHFIAVGIGNMEGGMAKGTVIRLADGVPVSMAQATPDFLLARGRVFVPRDPQPPSGSGESRFEQVDGLKSFDPDRVYLVIVGPEPDGPFYRFDVVGGKAIGFGTGWPGGFLDDGETLRPAPIFVAPSGIAHTMPFHLATVKRIWGEPIRIDQR